MDIKNIISNIPSEDFIPPIVNDFVNLTNSGKLTKSRFLDLISNKYSYEKDLVDYFSRCDRKVVGSIAEAIEVLGIEECAFAIFNISLLKLLNKNLLDGAMRIYEMQIFTAVSSFFIAKEMKLASAWKAYLSGLYSNISYFFLLKHFPEEFEDLVTEHKDSISRINYEWETFGMTHSDISWLILGKAGISNDIREAVRSHHTRKEISSNLSKAKKDLSHSVYSGSTLTSLFYEHQSLYSSFKNDLTEFFNFSESSIGPLITALISDFRNKMKLMDIKDLIFPGYFGIIEKYENQINDLKDKLSKTATEVKEEKKQLEQTQKVLESYNKKLVGIAIKDPLTGIFNRRYLTERLNDEFIKAKKYDSDFVVITCDIDHFKNINDTYGHGFGDEVLIKLVQVIQKTIRKADLLARVGGEEFVILCNQSNDYDGILIAEKVRKKIERTSFVYDSKTEVPVTMSFGVAKFTKDIGSVQELLELSDNRLYLAKRNGRNRVVYSDSTNEALM